jgi:hypothetical protein
MICAPDGSKAERSAAAAAGGSQSERRPGDESGRLNFWTTKTTEKSTHEPAAEREVDRMSKIVSPSQQQLLPADESQTLPLLLLWAS